MLIHDRGLPAALEPYGRNPVLGDDNTVASAKRMTRLVDLEAGGLLRRTDRLGHGAGEARTSNEGLVAAVEHEGSDGQRTGRSGQNKEEHGRGRRGS
jgi:hypothetical protein